MAMKKPTNWQRLGHNSSIHSSQKNSQQKIAHQIYLFGSVSPAGQFYHDANNQRLTHHMGDDQSNILILNTMSVMQLLFHFMCIIVLFVPIP